MCVSAEDGPNVLLCDGCDKGFHLYCLDPPLGKVPAGEWMCAACLAQVYEVTLSRVDNTAFGVTLPRVYTIIYEVTGRVPITCSGIY